MDQVIRLSRTQVRRVDEIAIDRYEMPGIVLMENAAIGAASSRAFRRLPDAKILILCGKGNNGGDGYAMARHLAIAGRQVQVISTCPGAELSGDAAINRRIVEHMHLSIIDEATVDQRQALFEEAGIIVDCLLGTGAAGNPRGLAGELINQANLQRSALRVAIDIPSGLDCDSGECHDPVFKANCTLTFVAEKLGFQSASPEILGEVEVIPIGVPTEVIAQVAQE